MLTLAMDRAYMHTRTHTHAHKYQKHEARTTLMHQICFWTLSIQSGLYHRPRKTKQNQLVHLGRVNNVQIKGTATNYIHWPVAKKRIQQKMIHLKMMMIIIVYY